MKNIGILIVTMLFGNVSAFADTGNGGMSECISLSVQAALDEHSKNHALYPIPTIEVRESDGSPSNGIDIKVSVNKAISYYVIASPNSEFPGRVIKGCFKARVGYSK